MKSWPLQDAKNRFSSLVEACLTKGPQVVTKRGREAVIVMSVEEYKRLVRPKGDLVDFFQHSPLTDVTLNLERSKELPREIQL